MRNVIALVLLLLAGSMLAGCDDAAESGDYTAVNNDAASNDTEQGNDWLEAETSAVPEQWLVSRIAGAHVAAEDPRVHRIATRFDALTPVFAESRRMLANRSLQLHRMLAEAGIDESMDATLAVFAPAKRGNTIGNFSQYAGHYATLRRQGMSRAAARRTLWTKPRSAAE